MEVFYLSYFSYFRLDMAASGVNSAHKETADTDADVIVEEESGDPEVDEHSESEDVSGRDEEQ